MNEIAANAWTTFTSEEWNAVRALPRSFGLFVACALAYFAFIALRRKQFSLRQLLRDTFPKAMYSGPRFRVDLLNWIVQTALVGPFAGVITVVLSLGAGAALGDGLNDWLGPRPTLPAASWVLVALQVAVPFWCNEFADFGLHYLAHRVPYLWSLHRAHHSTEVLTYFAGARAHPLEQFTHSIPVDVIVPGVATGITLYLTGTHLLPQTAVILGWIHMFFAFSSQILAHSHAPISYGRFNAIVGGPIMHQLHHSAETHHRDKNFGTNTLIFDWLFGTLYIPKRGETWRFGLNEQELGENNPHKSLKDLYLEPLAHLWRQLAIRGSS